MRHLLIGSLIILLLIIGCSNLKKDSEDLPKGTKVRIESPSVRDCIGVIDRENSPGDIVYSITTYSCTIQRYDRTWIILTGIPSGFVEDKQYVKEIK